MIFNLTETINLTNEKGEVVGALFPGLIEEDYARAVLGKDFDAHVKKGAFELMVDPLPFKGWPTEQLGDRRSDQIVPITRGARYMIRCLICGYAADSAVTEEADAIASVASAHEPTHARYKATAYLPPAPPAPATAPPVEVPADDVVVP